jgi:hypothetical protein
MARIARSGAAARSKGRVATPSANELMRNLGTSIFGSEFQGIPTATSKAAFNKITDIMADNDAAMKYYNPTEYANLAGEYAPAVEYVDPTGQTKSARPFYEFVSLTGDLLIPGFEGPQNEEDESPANLTLVPTSTTNPERPRTVAAGYDEDEEKLTVVFRDGTFYNYYEVDANEWAAFKANRSKGAIIYQMLDFKPRGYADVSTLSKGAQDAFYRFSRGVQIHSKGKAPKQTSVKYKTLGQNNKPNKR